jgi:BirA family biotin operon repressor/biotin-[acetyl-CoA-carboxylase] ligase
MTGRQPYGQEQAPAERETPRGLRQQATEATGKDFGRLLAWLEEITSTIDHAREWLRAGAPHGAVVIAERQTAGRGRLGRVWASPKGGLWMSVITRPDIEPEKAGRLGLAIAVAAAEAIATEAGCEVELRWPNDLMVGGRKLGGVLVDAQITAGRTGGEEMASPQTVQKGAQRCAPTRAANGETAAGCVSEAILSIGVNVNVSVEDLPEDVRETAASLLNVTGRTHSVGAIAARLLANLEALRPSVTGDGIALAAAWRRRDALAGREVTVEVAGKRLPGLASGIDEMGRLRLVSAWGEHVVSAGEVISLRELHDEGPQARAE